jgi:hypothetical protein
MSGIEPDASHKGTVPYNQLSYTGDSKGVPLNDQGECLQRGRGTNTVSGSCISLGQKAVPAGFSIQKSDYFARVCLHLPVISLRTTTR